jgi:hypothetical protein
MSAKKADTFSAVWMPLGVGVVMQIVGYWLALANQPGTKVLTRSVDILRQGSATERTGSQTVVDIGLILGGIGSVVMFVALVTLAVLNALRIHAAD